MVYLFDSNAYGFCSPIFQSHSIHLFPVLTMKKFLKYIIGFSLIYLVLHVMVVISVGPLVTYYRIGSAGQMFNRVKDIPNHHGPDVLFIGSSHTYRGFDTRLFEKAGYKSFNLGSSAQTPMQTELLLHRYLDEINPKSIVFEVYHVLFQNDGIESMADLISNDHIDMEICKMAFKSENVKLINTLIYGIYQEYFRSIREKCKATDTIGDDVYVSGGYVEKLSHDPFVPDSTVSSNVFKMNPRQLRAFSRCVGLAKEKGIPFLLVNTPLPQSTKANLGNLETFDETMSSIGIYLNFSELMQLDDSCFYDANHLNQNGVELFNRRLIQVMDSLRFLD